MTLKEPLCQLDSPLLPSLGGDCERLSLFSEETFCRVSKAAIEHSNNHTPLSLQILPAMSVPGTQ